MTSPVFVNSEIGKLKKVFVHTPDIEIEAMTPKTAESLLYNDIVPLSIIRNEHLEFKRILSLFCETCEITDLLKKVLSIEEAKFKLIKYLCSIYNIKFRQNDILLMSDKDILKALVCGLKSRKDSLDSFLHGDEFDLPPIPNLYFTRDSSMVLGDSVIIASMANKVRKLESVLLKFIFMYHPDFSGTNILFDGTDITNNEISIEGGDLIVLSDDVYVIGISQRTSSKAIDIISSKFKKPAVIFAVILPDERASIHLDMVFTIAGPDKALVYGPYITGRSPLSVVKMEIEPGRENRITMVDNLLKELKKIGICLDPVFCGGMDPVKQQRNQWLSGNNFFSFAPGKIIGYDCNEETLEALNNNGYEIISSKDINASDSGKILSLKNIALTLPGSELARGGGGPRCMTMPVERESFDMRQKC